MKWSTYSLEQKVIVQNAIGQCKESWERVDDVRVAISSKLYTTVTNDAVYRKYEPTGITTYKKLEIDASYRIVSEEHTYLVTSFNIDSRFTQLLLKEVV